jgi:uncharacterized protein (DUF433 family)
MAATASEAVKSIVTVSPDVMSGVPVFRGTRVPVKNLLDYLAAGDSLDEFLAQFPTVKREQALRSLGRRGSRLRNRQ